MNLIHVTHEATHKIGGIGTVLEGLLTSSAYQAAVSRSILVGTWSLGTPPAERLGRGARVLYSICDGIDEGGWRRLFRPIEHKYQVWFTYGKRTFRDGTNGGSAEVEVLLVEASEINRARLDYLKATLYQRYAIASAEYESQSDYLHWLRIAEPAYEALLALLRATEGATSSEPTFVIAHEYMGMPTALKAIVERDENVYTALYAHEVATVRPHVEGHPGHDTRFYNLMEQARREGLHISDVLGSQRHSYRHALIERAQHCDAIIAVGDRVVDELRFLSPAFADAPIHKVYNGIAPKHISLAERRASKAKLAQYCQSLLGFSPDYVFTHVTRMVLSKGLWRDIRVLDHFDGLMAGAGRTAVLFVLSTEIGLGRPGADVRRMEAAYGWPVRHREGFPDLTGMEIGFSRSVDAYNARSRAVKVVFVNQFGWSRSTCGERMPAEMEFLDIRQGSDVEFGQSIYEPFGIAQVETLSFGAICVMTNVCGCVGFVLKAAGGQQPPNLIVADYTTLQGGHTAVPAIAQIGWAERDMIEAHESRRVAEILFQRLPKTDEEERDMIQRGYDIASRMSWDVVVREYLLPALESARTRH